MNAKTLAILSLALATAGGAIATENNYPPSEPFVSTKTRAEVKAELADFRRVHGDSWFVAYTPPQDFTSSTTRAAVTADYLTARANGTAFNEWTSGERTVNPQFSAQAVHTPG